MTMTRKEYNARLKANEGSGDTEGLVRIWVDNATGTKPGGGVAPWPGLPVSQIPFSCTPAVNALIASGEMRYVERPAAVDPQRKAKFLARTNA